MQELPDLIFEGDDTVVTMKVHKLAYNDRGLIAYASLAGPANAVKVIRGGLSEGIRPFLEGLSTNGLRLFTVKPGKNGEKPYRFRYAGLGDGYVHVELRLELDYAVVVVQDTEDEWHTELLRLTTAPILPEYVPWLREAIKKPGSPIELRTFNCDAAGVWQCDDAKVGELVVEGVKAGALVLPECETDMHELKGLSDYIGAYATKMVDSAGSALHPLFDPRLEAPAIPPMKRAPFTPQAWMVEALRRCVA